MLVKIQKINFQRESLMLKKGRTVLLLTLSAEGGTWQKND